MLRLCASFNRLFTSTSRELVKSKFEELLRGLSRGRLLIKDPQIPDGVSLLRLTEKRNDVHQVIKPFVRMIATDPPLITPLSNTFNAI